MLLVVIGEPPRARLQVVGDLSSATAPRLAHLLRGLLDAGYGQVDLDLSCLEVLGAAGLNVLNQAGTRFDEAGARLRLTVVPARIRRIFTGAGLDVVVNPPPVPTTPAARSSGHRPGGRTYCRPARRRRP
jgi:anti-anti-sigma factor